MKFSRRRFSIFFVFSLVFICLAAEAKAAVFTVTHLGDSGGGSLRQAINDANAAPGENIINFQTGLAGTIDVLSALPDLSNAMTINGPGPDLLTVRRFSGTTAYRVFNVTSTVVLNGLTISGGVAPDTGGPKFTVRRGSGISAQGNLVLNNCRVTGNSASGSIIEGAGIYNTGALVVRNSEITNNSLVYFGSAGHSYGSGIYNEGIAIVEDSTISGNSGAAAIHNARGMTISRSSITNNINAMGIFSFTQVGGSPISILIENSTVSGNSGIGAWLYSNSPMEVRSSTITNNQNYGLLISGTGRLDNNIIAGNTNKDAVGNFTANSSYNLIGKGEDSNLVNGQNGNIVGTTAAPVNAQLAPLGNYGGRTPTHKLLNTSPAINAGNPTDFLITDQRGVVRPVGGSPDIGAFEFNLTPHRILPRGGLNAAYNQTLTAFSNVPEPVFTFAVTEGALPPGLSLAPLETNAVALAGTPTGTGIFNFTITATNAGGFTISASYSLTIQTAVSFAAVRGRVLNNDGKPVGRAFILLFDANGNVIKQAFTNPFGYYRFKDVQAGEIYGFKVFAKNRHFTPLQNVTVNGELNDFNFTAAP
ncbi:MAG TPA: choice-of-anchor Q domain-containing protein [Pyrinomonadaceae bacterium]